MNKLTQTLLTGSALCGLVTAPAVAQPTHPAMHVMALHAGHAVNKTKFHIPGRQHVTYTFGVYTEKTANARKTDLLGTFYRWNDTTGGHYTTVCSRPKQHLKVPKNSIYARVDPGTETYSFGCPSGPTVFYGDVWTNKTGVPGDVDTFRSSLLGHLNEPNGKYKGTYNFDVHVTITQ